MNLFEEAKDKVPKCYYLFNDSIIMTPMSNDSKEHSEFINLYTEYFNENWIKNERINHRRVKRS